MTGNTADKVTAVLAAEIAGRTRWDEPPALYFVYVTDGEPLLRRLPLPGEWWSRNRPPVVLDMMSRVTSQFAPFLSAVSPEDFYGAAFYCETWLVEEPPPGTAERSEVVEDAHAHRLYTRPDRVEARSMWAAGRDGTLYEVVQCRDLDAEPHAVTPYGGMIPDALSRMVAAYTNGTASVV